MSSADAVIARPGTDPAGNPWERWGWAFAAIWLVFLIYPVTEAWQADRPLGLRLACLACIVGFGIVNVLGYSLWAGRGWRTLALMAVFGLLTIPVIGIGAVGLTPYLGMMAALQTPGTWWKVTTPIAGFLPVASTLGGDFPFWFFLMAWPVILAGAMIRMFNEREREAEVERQSLLLTAERERVARDVHDVLGHSLTALSVKAELAGRLIDVDPERAKLELASLQETARQALAEVRATVGGLRAGNLGAELAAAPQVLADAGIETVITGSIAETDPRHRALLAWVLRECVTNVVRHAHAGRVDLELRADGLVVRDDGRGRPHEAEGNGLRGMRERVQAAGGVLEIEGPPGTTVRAVLP